MTTGTIGGLLALQAVDHGGRPAIDDGDRSLDHASLDAAANAFGQQLLERGIMPGGRLAVLARPGLETVLAMYGCAKAGVVFCPVPASFTPYEVEKVLSAMAPDAAFVEPRFEPLLAQADCSNLIRVEPDAGARSQVAPPPCGPDDPAWILWTSGSTAFPKPALLPGRSATGSAHAYARAFRTGPEDSWLNFFPLFHVGGLEMVVLHALAAGARLRLMPDGFDPADAMRIIDEERITRCGGFDVFWNKMRVDPLWSRTDFSSVGSAIVGGNLQTYDLLEEVGIELIVTGYGSTETSLVSITAPEERNRELRKLASGRILPGNEVRVVDTDTGREVPRGERGELTVRGPLLFLGYDGEESGAAFDDDGWFHTGDYGWVDDEDRVWWRGRFKQMVKSGGENVSCAEVQIAIETLCDEVVSAQVIGVPDETWGEAVVAFVEVREGHPFHGDGIRSRLRERLAGFKVPKSVFPMTNADWPLTLTGKVRREELVERAVRLRAVDDG